jgi:hypothetical protein
VQNDNIAIIDIHSMLSCQQVKVKVVTQTLLLTDEQALRDRK